MDNDLSSDFSSETGEWIEAGPDEEETLDVVSLLDDRVFPDAVSMLSYCKEKFGLDFLGDRKRLGLDFHGTVKLINFIRQRVHEGIALPSSIGPADLADDRYLKPVLEDDALILYLDDLPEPEVAPAARTKGKRREGEDAATVQELLQQKAELQAELEQLAHQFSDYRLTVEQTLDKRWCADEETEGTKVSGMAASGGGKVANDSRGYFEGYAHNGKSRLLEVDLDVGLRWVTDIHETMLKDTVRTDAYRDFIYTNRFLFVGKTVLDVGCGTGILSMFCAKAGASRVIAVDNSAIADKARENIFHNGLSDLITVLKGKIEEVVLPVPQVDIIVSEWMGYALLYEAMLPSVLWARDSYLVPGGLMVPSHATMWLAPVADPQYVTDNVGFWRDVYGFDMRAMQEGICDFARVETLSRDAVCGAPCAFRMLDLHTVTTADLSFETGWRSELADGTEDVLDGFLLWFDIFFASSRHDERVAPGTTLKDWVSKGGVAFTTGPYGARTHWAQVLLLLDRTKTKEVKLAAGNDIAGELKYSIPDDHARGLMLTVTWASGEERQRQVWRLE